MAKKEKQEQMDLIDVGPENLEQIKVHATAYKRAQQARLKALEKEIQEKQAILDLVREADLKRLGDGRIVFKCDGMVISITPRDELIKIREVEGDG